MNKTMKKILSLLTGVLLLVSAPMVLQAAEPSDSEFSGTREIEYVVSISDLENYSNGGRSGFDISIRSNIPDDVSYEIYTVDRNVHVKLFFDFESKEEYGDILRRLCGVGINFICPETEQLVLIELVNAYEYFNFAFDSTYIEDVRAKMDVSKNSLWLGDTEYTFGDSVDIRPDFINENGPVLVDELSIYTECNSEGIYSSRIAVRVSEDYEGEKADYYKKKFRKVGEVEVDESAYGQYVIHVDFTALNEMMNYALMEEALGCMIFTEEAKQNTDSGKLIINQLVYFDVKSMLVDNGSFRYEVVFADYYEHLQQGEGCSIVNSTNLLSQSELITYSYEKDFYFSEVSVSTDLSRLFGKIKRTIRLSIEKEIDVFYHEEIKKEIGERLIDGSVMTITEDQNYVYYTIEFSTYLREEIAEFTKAVLKSKSNFEFNVTLFGKESEISEKFSFDKIVNDMSPVETVCVKYVLPSGVEVSRRSIKNATQWSEGCIMFDRANYEKIEVVYDCINWITIIGLGVVGLLLVLGVICIVLIFRNSRRKIEEPI